MLQLELVSDRFQAIRAPRSTISFDYFHKSFFLFRIEILRPNWQSI